MVTRKKHYPDKYPGFESIHRDEEYKFTKKMIPSKNNLLTVSTFNDVIPNQHPQYPYNNFQKPDDLGVLQTQTGTYDTKEVKVFNPLTQEYQTFKSKQPKHIVGIRDSLSFNHILSRGENVRVDIVANSSLEAQKDNYNIKVSHQNTLLNNKNAFSRRPSLYNVNTFNDEKKEAYMYHSKSENMLRPGTTSLSRSSMRKSVSRQSYVEYFNIYIIIV